MGWAAVEEMSGGNSPISFIDYKRFSLGFCYLSFINWLLFEADVRPYFT